MKNKRNKIKVLPLPMWAHDRWIESCKDGSFIETKPIFNRPGMYRRMFTIEMTPPIIKGNFDKKIPLVHVEYLCKGEMKAYLLHEQYWETEMSCNELEVIRFTLDELNAMMFLESRITSGPVSKYLQETLRSEYLKREMRLSRLKTSRMLKKIKDDFKRKGIEPK